MIGYLDTSAFVPLLVDEPTSESCLHFWDQADDIASSRLLYVEAASALAKAHRLSRLTGTQRRSALKRLDHLWRELDVIEPDAVVVQRAAALTFEHGLRGFDAIHCASAERIHQADLVAATGDQQLLQAWLKLGISTFDPHRTPGG